MRKRVAVLLSGCGMFDGSEIHEAVLILLTLDRAGIEYICAAPDMDQYHVMNHLTQEEMDETRNVLIEASRIARGNITALNQLEVADIDAMIIPGGFGAAKNFSDFAIKGPQIETNQQVHDLIRQMHEAKKPIGAIGISVAAVVDSLKQHEPHFTIGEDSAVASALDALGGVHHRCGAMTVNVDSSNKLVSTPAYMLTSSLKDVAVGIETLVHQVAALIKE